MYKTTLMHSATAGQDKNFKFYGKVVDDSGVPVSDAIVVLGVSHYDPFAEYLRSTKRVETKTDAKGAFLLSDKGGTIFIKEIVKSGYEYTYEMNAENNSFNLSDQMKTIKFEKAHPVVYYLRKRGEPAYMYAGRHFSWPFKLDDNRPFQLALLNAWVDKDGFVHGRERRYPKIIDMNCVFSEDLLQYEITFTYLGENGGLIASDQAFYEAPVEGYTKSVTLKGNMIDHWDGDDGRQNPMGKNDEPSFLYVKGDEGDYHSRIELKISTQPDRGRLGKSYCQVRVTGKAFTNPDGTLSLEHDPEYVRKEKDHRDYIYYRRKKAKQEAAVKKQKFDEKVFIKQIREEEKNNTSD